MPLLTPWGTPSSLSGGRILKCFPHSVARSAARTVAGQTLKSEAAEVRGSGTGRLEPNLDLCSQRMAYAGLRSLYSIHCDGRVAPPHASAHSMGNAIIFIWGPNFEMLPHPMARSAARTVVGPTPLQRLFSFVASYRSRHVEEPT